MLKGVQYRQGSVFCFRCLNVYSDNLSWSEPHLASTLDGKEFDGLTFGDFDTIPNRLAAIC